MKSGLVDDRSVTSRGAVPWFDTITESVRDPFTNRAPKLNAVRVRSISGSGVTSRWAGRTSSGWSGSLLPIRTKAS